MLMVHCSCMVAILHFAVGKIIHCLQSTSLKTVHFFPPPSTEFTQRVLIYLLM